MSTVKRYKPTTPARRGAGVLDFSDLAKKRPEKKLRIIIKKTGGRNNKGRITVRHIGGGHKRFYRIIDFKRNKYEVEAAVVALEYDPNRSAYIALVEYPDKEKRYILAPEELKVGDNVMSSKKEFKTGVGNSMPLALIPAGIMVHNIELKPGGGGILARSAGSSVLLQSKEKGMAQLKMPSGEIRLVSDKCMATLGTVGNSAHRNVRLGKAGRKRHRGVRPTVTGKSMNPVDHPHGGGEGHQPIGMKGPKNIYGKKAYGVKTRKKSKPSSKLIIKRRKSKRQ
jgi:large subunit ribosomal protein L2